MTITLSLSFWTVFKWAGLVIVPLGVIGLYKSIVAPFVNVGYAVFSAFWGERNAPDKKLSWVWPISALVMIGWLTTIIVRGLMH